MLSLLTKRLQSLVFSNNYQPANADRRTHHRAPLTIAVKQRIGNELHLCLATDISTSGIFVKRVAEGNTPTENTNEISGSCWLEFSLPQSDVTIAAQGRVIWQKQKERYAWAALRFQRIAPSHRRLIQRYCAQLLAPSACLCPREDRPAQSNYQ